MRSSEVIVHNACNNHFKKTQIRSSGQHPPSSSIDLFNPWTGFLENIKNPALKIAKKKLMSTHL